MRLDMDDPYHCLIGGACIALIVCDVYDGLPLSAVCCLSEKSKNFFDDGGGVG